MPGFSRHNDFAFSSTLINAFDPCSTVSRKRQWQLNTNDPEFVPVKIKRRHQNQHQHQQHPPTTPTTTSTRQDQENLNAQSDPTTGTVDYSALLRELEPLSGEALFERLVTLPLPQVYGMMEHEKAMVFICVRYIRWITCVNKERILGLRSISWIFVMPSATTPLRYHQWLASVHLFDTWSFLMYVWIIRFEL